MDDIFDRDLYLVLKTSLKGDEIKGFCGRETALILPSNRLVLIFFILIMFEFSRAEVWF